MIPERYRKAEWSDVPQVIRDSFFPTITAKKGIYLHGAVGVGKTHVAYAMLNWWDLQKQTHAQFWNVTELIHELKLDFDRREKNWTGEDLLKSDRLLFLDDIGAEKMTEWVQETIYLLVNRRYNKMLPTIFTSNLPIADLADRVGDRTASRIVEMCEIIKLEGTDRRLKK